LILSDHRFPSANRVGRCCSVRTAKNSQTLEERPQQRRFSMFVFRGCEGTGNGTLHAMHVGGTWGEPTPRLGGFDLRVALNPARSPGNVQEI
jgi:hypothetical protein